MRIALLSYRSKPHCGGQGVYVRHLSRALVRRGHDVEVFSAAPYPDLDEGVRLTRVPGLDLYREPDPFRVPHLRELRDRTDVAELLTVWAGGFPEPRTFSTRVVRLLRERRDDFDVVHDNQTLGAALLEVEGLGLPMVTTIHHPITIDRRLDLAAARTRRRRLAVRRWYGFVRMQARVARAARVVLTPSEVSRDDVVAELGVDADRVRVVPLGVDEAFRPPTTPRHVARILALASADTPLKGVATLLEAVAKLRTERELELVLVSRPRPGGPTERLVDRLGLGPTVRFVHDLSDAELVRLMGSATVACVPSLHEGFSLPTAEMMACGTPLVVSRAGAIPEVVGPDGEAAELVPPGDAEALRAALARLLDDPERRERLGLAARRRAVQRFSWSVVAEQVEAVYTDAVAGRPPLPEPPPSTTRHRLRPSRRGAPC